MGLIKVIWHSITPQTEALRILFTAHKLATHQYQHFSWLVLPELPVSPPPNLIIYPDLDYPKLPQFWPDVIQSVVQTTPPQAPQSLISATAKLFVSSQYFSRYYYQNSTLYKSWVKLETQFLQKLLEVIPISQTIKQINIYPTQFGSSKSFSLLTRRVHTINLFVRLDQPATAIIDGIVSAIIRGQLQSKIYLSWTETESAKDSILLNTSLSLFCPDYSSTLAATRNYQQGKLVEMSKLYLAKLHLDYQNPWSIDKNRICYQNSPINFLTSQESIILETLIKNFPETVSIDVLSEKLSPTLNDFSLWKISKSIQRLREKLATHNISPQTIHTIRKRGFILATLPQDVPVNEKIF